MEASWREVEVDVGWGRLMGKTCVTGGGTTEDKLRVLAVHGWMDNANTFDTLVPILPVGLEILVLDLPGHGHSDHMPLGSVYTILSYSLNLRKALCNYGWDKFILLTHSMGSTASFFLAAMFPESVIAFISLDSIFPNVNCISPLDWRKEALTLFKSERYEREQTPVYEEQEAIERLGAARDFQGTTAGIKDAIYILLPRSCRQVRGGYTWTHDPRVRSKFTSFFATDTFFAALSSLKCPVLILLATHGAYMRKSEEVERVIEAYRDNKAWFELEYVEGSHYVHLTHPHRVAPSISTFISKVKSTLTPQKKSKL